MLSVIADDIMHKPVSIKRYTKPKQTFTMKQFFISMFSNSEGTSHKRVLGTIGFIALIVFLFTSSDAHKTAAVAAVEYITIATVFGTVVEKFASKKQNNDPEI